MKSFEEVYPRSCGTAPPTTALKGLDPEVQQLLAEYGGASYADGIYRIFDATESRRWTEKVQKCFPTESNNVEAFGGDWQGNVFGYRASKSPCTLLFQLGTGNVFEVAESIQSFHNEELTLHAEEALSLSLWQEWRRSSPAPTTGQCIAYKTPIFLGGDVVVDNLAVADVDVYWEVVGQLLEQIRKLPDGTAIEKVILTYLN